MAAAPARRKHGACLLRIKENCPLRKFRKNRCYDVTATSSAGGGVCWGDFSKHPISASKTGPINTIYVEPLPPSYQSIHRPHQSQDPIAVDMEVVRPQAPITGVMSLPPSSVLAPGPLVPNLQPAYQHRRLPSAASSEASMELDSGVDPETGERAQR
ncbi:uncharacterized protein LOC118946878 [Oncorhynchus mykiss]|uniref:uncharacterized protein LOC118946878 n=1 Tax=Oncorhynchus mykiss TaxID=8022 RepID=UPI0018779EEB|nr:uncharacterized protein LOC118946878 [Oncorhynchus mykiss]